MGRYVKMPVEIEAVRFTGIAGEEALFEDEQPDGTPPPEWLTEAIDGLKGSAGSIWLGRHEGKEYLFIGTLEGDHRAEPGDWIIRGIKGELYPCKPDIFARTYADEEMAKLSSLALVADAVKGGFIEFGDVTPPGDEPWDAHMVSVQFDTKVQAEALFKLLSAAKIASEAA
jgi:hypothetical protein